MNMLKTKITVSIFLLLLFGYSTFAQKYVMLNEPRTYKFSETIRGTNYENFVAIQTEQQFNYLFIIQNNRIVRILYAVEDSSTIMPENTIEFDSLFAGIDNHSWDRRDFLLNKIMKFNDEFNKNGNEFLNEALNKRSIFDEIYYGNHITKEKISTLNKFPMIVKLKGKYLKIKPYQITIYFKYINKNYYEKRVNLYLLDTTMVNDSFSKNNKSFYISTFYYLLDKRTIECLYKKEFFLKDSDFITNADENNFLDLNPIGTVKLYSNYNTLYGPFVKREKGQKENKNSVIEKCLGVQESIVCDFERKIDVCPFFIINPGHNFSGFRYITTIENIPIYKQLIDNTEHNSKFPDQGFWFLLIPDIGYFISRVTNYENGCYFYPDLEDRTFLINDMPIAEFLRSQTPNK